MSAAVRGAPGSASGRVMKLNDRAFSSNLVIERFFKALSNEID